MVGIIRLKKRTALEEVIRNNDKQAIASLISRKEQALKEATSNAAFYASINNDEMADNETARKERLTRDINKLKQALKN